MSKSTPPVSCKHFLRNLTILITLILSFNVSAQQKVVGGVDVEIKDYPWQVALTSSPNGSGFCGGSIIGDSWVLTAAHCVNGDSPSGLYIRCGASASFASGGESYSVNQIIVHPDYSGNSYDFALVEINGEFEYSAFIQKIDLIDESEIAAGAQDGGVMSVITGWGTTSSGGSLASVLQMVEAPIVENDVACGSATDENGNSGQYPCSSLDASMICAGDLINGGEDACQGDSGGPLVVRSSDNSRWLLIGATSWGYGCADVLYPGVWSKVSHVLDWINDNADVNSEYGCMDITACNYDPEAIYDNGACAELDDCGECGGDNSSCSGCTDENACNFDSSMIFDDGTCAEFDECGDCGGDGPAPGYDCDGNCTTGETLNVTMSDSYGDGWNGNALIVNGISLTIASGSSGSGVVCYDSSAGCVDVTCDGGTWQEEVSWEITDVNGDVLISGGAPFEGAFGGAGCGPVFGCTDSTALNFNAEATADNNSCLYPVAGCMDTLALNYNIAAVEDDGSCEYPIDCSDLTSVSIEVGGGTWDSEISWSIGGFSGSAESTQACLEDGCQTFTMYDSYGDGWNSALVTITDSYGDVLLSGTLEGYVSEGTLSFGLNTDEQCGPVLGCTDTLALNFDIDATSDDGSCTYPVSGCVDSLALNYNELAVQDDGSCVYPQDCDTANSLTLMMYDSYGDGWNGNVFTVSTNGQEFASATLLSSESEGAASFCLNDGCYLITVDGGSWQYEVSWDLVNQDGDLVLSGNAPYESTLSLNFEGECGLTYGCTDSLALNYNPAATSDDNSCTYPVVGCTDSLALNYIPDAVEDDGSCEYPLNCDNSTSVTINVTDGFYPYEVSWVLNDFSGEVGSIQYCLEDGCHTFTMLDSYGDGWNGSIVTITTSTGEELFTGTLQAGYSGDMLFSLNAECGYVDGCTDPSALNFDNTATIDDGSCEYDCVCPEIYDPVCGLDGITYSSSCHASCAGVEVNYPGECEIIVDPIFGCTDISALNYNQMATEDDGSCEYPVVCEGYAALLVVNNASFGVEHSWSVTDANGAELYQGGQYFDNTTIEVELCLEANTSYSINLSDSYGDGWNGGSFFILSENQTCELAYGGMEQGNEATFDFTTSCDGDNPGVAAPWEVTVTGSNHTLVIDGAVQIDLVDVEIEIGDVLGVFFSDENGDLQCGGMATWTGSTNLIAAQGDDTTTDELDGFSSNEGFVWMVWDTSEGLAYMVNAEYDEMMSNQGNYVTNGISALSTLTSTPTVTDQTMDMPFGWSIFSTYLTFDNMDLVTLLSPIFDQIIICKNNAGAAYLPEYGFNGIGDVELGQGYQIKLLNEISITAEGEYLAPEENPTILTAGWNMIGYIRLQPADASAVLSEINSTGNLVIAKDFAGNAYLPEFNFNGIGDFVSGQGYQLKVTNDDVLNYLSNEESYRVSSIDVINNHSSHFESIPLTDNNMTVVIEDASWDVLPKDGAEIAAYDANGTLVGSAKYTSPVTVLTVWGDDALTSSKDGLNATEVSSFKLWSNNQTSTFEVTKWVEGSSTYTTNEINVASSIVTNTSSAALISSQRVLVKVINVLGQEVVVDDSFSGEVLFNVYNDGTVEKMVR